MSIAKVWEKYKGEYITALKTSDEAVGEVKKDFRFEVDEVSTAESALRVTRFGFNWVDKYFESLKERY